MPIPDSLNEFEPKPSVYGTFIQRLLATIIDTLIFIPVIGIDRFNKTDWKSAMLLTITFLIELIYKPLMEYQFGATLGKKCIKIMVVNSDYQKVDLKEVLVRNIFNIVASIFFFGVTLIIFMKEEFLKINSIRMYTDLEKADQLKCL